MPRHSDIRFTFESASSVAFDVAGFRLEESLSQPFVLNVDLSSCNPSVDFGQVLDQPACLTIWRGEQPIRYVHGVVSTVEQGTTGFRRTRYSVVVEPRMARAGLRSNWRISQQQTVPEILQTVLKRSGVIDVEQRLSKEHLPREYCVQPGESDLDFFQRLSAEEGLYYAFEHSAHGHRLIQGDVLYTHGVIPGGPVTYNPMPAGDSDEPCLHTFRYTENVRTARQVQRDYTFKHPRYNQQHASDGNNLTNQARDYERYDYPGRYKQDEAGKPFTKTRLLSLRRDAQVATVEGDDARLQPGLAFDLQGHPREAWNTGWRAIAIVHTGVQNISQEEDSSDATTGTHYSYTAEIIPDQVEWKAPLCPKPRIDGPQIATVVGPQGEEIFCDEFGRVKVQFPWDREGNHDEHSSCWIRVSQNWAGAAWGHMALPRIGQEVIIGHLDGDCDQPILIGRTYPATHPTPYELPRHKTRMTIKSQTHKGNGSNELRFEDEKDQEEIYVHAQKDQNIIVNNDETTRIGHDRQENVENDETIRIGHDRTESVGNDEQVTIGRNRTHQIGQDAFLSIERNHAINIGKDRHETVGNNRHDKTTANHVIDIGGHVEQTVQGHHKLSAGQSIERQTQRYQLHAGESIEIKVQAGSITIDSNGIVIDALKILIKGPVQQSSGAYTGAAWHGAAFAESLLAPFITAPIALTCAAWSEGGTTGTQGYDTHTASMAPQATDQPAASENNATKDTATPPSVPHTPAPMTCDWKLKSFKETHCSMPMETATYYQLDENKRHVLDRDGKPTLCSGPATMPFELAFDGDAKVLTAAVRIAVKLKDMYELDAVTGKPKADTEGRPIGVPYDSTGNGSNAPPEVRAKFLVANRSVATLDFTGLKQRIERVLNQNNYRLTLSDCAQGAACGCIVPVQFVVHFLDPGVKGQGKPHDSIDLFPRAVRADAGSWSELTVSFDKFRNEFVTTAVECISAHEAGHLFSWPDEYWSNGGSIHQQYVKQQEIDFTKGDELKGQLVWQLNTDDTLMGYGAYKNSVQTPEYYLYRIRDWFTRKTGKRWKLTT
ncbi:type VI secretion system tip protein TssI/VgrG [Dyella sp. C11]|uniref:type VI secretion system Vgr family protein n=1 Tax=Dyella sp. C11 TaxID=2126991 RepID=UPI000D656F63|nr:type VI secretion system tip protein TssI/VgrG [Dyella sp. C11]